MSLPLEGKVSAKQAAGCGVVANRCDAMFLVRRFSSSSVKKRRFFAASPQEEALGGSFVNDLYSTPSKIPPPGEALVAITRNGCYNALDCRRSACRYTPRNEAVDWELFMEKILFVCHGKI